MILVSETQYMTLTPGVPLKQPLLKAEGRQILKELLKAHMLIYSRFVFFLTCL